jgi:uncharacterized protein GlcG (DUF336 family)
MLNQFSKKHDKRSEAVLSDKSFSLLKLICKHSNRKITLISSTVIFVAIVSLSIISCDSENNPVIPIVTGTPDLTVADVQEIITHAVEQAQRLNVTAAIAVLDREGDVLGVYRMTGAGDPLVFDDVTGAIAKARTAAYLSSNQHGFTSLTACFITREHFPPGISNTPGGPLYGVPFSSVGGGDVQPNGDIAQGRPSVGGPGLTGVPGGVPIFKDGRLAGGLGVSGGALDFTLDLCSGISEDEIIALGSLGRFTVPEDKRGDVIFIDGIRLLFANADTPPGNFTLTFGDLAALGTVDAFFPIRATPTLNFPIEGEVNLGPGFDFSVTAGDVLSATDVQQIIDQAVAQANKTRAAIRRPIGSAARVFISVVDTNGTVLGIWRTPDATIFSYDVSAQKARTVIAYSRPDHPLGMQIRNILGVGANQPLAMTCRALGFLSQDFFPPGIDEETIDRDVVPGPLYEGPEFVLQQNLGLNPYGNGITIFPGGIPLYKNGILAGAIGISGDGVDQDDYIAFGGSQNFEPPESIRCDQFFYDDIRLPYVKFPRRPEIGD